jgi:predicted O-methyltransferase YrrM
MTREDLAKMATGVGVELGVAGGAYSDTLLRLGKLRHLYSIDRWSDHHDQAEYERAKELLSQHRRRSVILRTSFSEAVKAFTDGSLDFAYIDGYAHEGQEGGKTLADWWPKLRSGGIFAGHDYSPRYPATVKAVDEFAAAHGLTVNVTDAGTGGVFDSEPSWWVVKP